MNDKELAKAIQLIGGGNGRFCGRTTYDRGSFSTVCRAYSRVEEGKVKVYDTCAELCDFVCKHARGLQEKIDELQRYDELITKVKSSD